MHAPVGNAVLWRHDRLEAIEEDENINANTRVAVGFKGKVGSELELLGLTVVVSVHLDATSEEQRVKQLTKAMEHGRQLGTRNVIIAGDMNTECLPGSCVTAMLSNQPEPTEDQIINECISAYRLTSNDNHEEDTMKGASEEEQVVKTTSSKLTSEVELKWQSLRTQAMEIPLKYRIELSRVSIGDTRAGYDHGCSEGPCKSWALDHLFYNPQYLLPMQRWSSLEHDVESLSLGLPNRKCPSDHLPIASSFQLIPLTSLNQDEIDSLKEEWGVMLQSFEREKNEISHQFDLELAELEKKEIPINVTSTDNSESQESRLGDQKKKAKKINAKLNKKGKPSEAVMLCMRKKRESLKELAVTQESLRLQRVSQFNNIQLDVVESFSLFGIKVPSGGKFK